MEILKESARISNSFLSTVLVKIKAIHVFFLPIGLPSFHAHFRKYTLKDFTDYIVFSILNSACHEKRGT